MHARAHTRAHHLTLPTRSSPTWPMYRECFDKVQGPKIPYLAVSLRDITFINIGNSNYNEDGSINVDRLAMLHQQVQNIRRLQVQKRHNLTLLPSTCVLYNPLSPEHDLNTRVVVFAMAGNCATDGGQGARQTHRPRAHRILSQSSVHWFACHSQAQPNLSCVINGLIIMDVAAHDTTQPTTRHR
jgi:hypothetical protein